MTTTVIRTPERDTSPTALFFQRPSDRVDSLISSRQDILLSPTMKRPLQPSRDLQLDQGRQSPTRSVTEPVVLSFGTRPSVQRPSLSDPSSSQPRRPAIEPVPRLTKSTSRPAAEISATPARTPSVRPPQLTLTDLNAPKAKRRSIDFSQTLLPRLVLTPPDGKKSRAPTIGRLPAPDFTRPLLRRASTSPPQTPLPTDDWSTHMNNHSDSMRKLSLHEKDPVDDIQSPLRFKVPDNLSPKPRLPLHLRHRRTRSTEVKSAKRLSLGKISNDVFDANSSSSPFAAVTPTREPNKDSGQIFVWQPGFATPLPVPDHPMEPVVAKPRADSLPEFVIPVEKGIAQKRSIIGLQGSVGRAKVLRARPSMLFDKFETDKAGKDEKELLRSRDSGLVGFSFEGEHDGGDESFASMTSLGEPVEEVGKTNFLDGLKEGPHVTHPAQFSPAPAMPLITPGFAPAAASGWPALDDVNLAGLDPNDEGTIDIDSLLFSTMQAKQATRTVNNGSQAKPMMPDTPVKASAWQATTLSRPWQSTMKQHSVQRAKMPPRKSLPLKFAPMTPIDLAADSPDSDVGYFDSLSNPSPSPTLRTAGNLAPRRSYGRSPIGLGRPGKIPTSQSSPPFPPSHRPSGLFDGMLPSQTKSGSDLLSSMGINKRRADIMRRTSSSAWSFSSDSGSEGFGTPSKYPRGDEWNSPLFGKDGFAVPEFRGNESHRVSFVDSSPLRRLSDIHSTRPLSPLHPESRLSSAGSSPIKFNTFPFNRPASPLPNSSFFSDVDDDNDDDVVLDYGIKEETGRFEHEFIVEDTLGAGSFGQAYRVRSRATTGNVKLKLYAIKKSKRYEGPRHRLRLLEEFDALRHLSSKTTSRRSRSLSLSQPSPSPCEPPNANILQFVHGWEQDSMLFIQTELCEFGNLADFLFEFGAKFARLDEPRIWKIMSEVGNGILHIHHQNIIHLDLKPENIFITMEGRLRIGDFGMASRWPRPASFGDGSEGLDREGDREYMAPEILKGRYGPEADIFSFGMIMLECAGNIVVPDMGDPWHRLRQQDFTDVDLTGLTPTLVDMITRLMASNPADRPRIDQVCAHDVVMKTRSLMLRNIETVRRASFILISNAAPSEADAAREAANVALFKASCLGTEDETFLNQVFENTNVVSNDERMDLTP